jgi:hypothetical protein
VRFNPYLKNHTTPGKAQSARISPQPKHTSDSGNTPQPHTTTLMHNHEIFNPYTWKHITRFEPRFPNPPALPHTPTSNTLTVSQDLLDPSALSATPNTLQLPIYFNPYNRHKTTGEQVTSPHDTSTTVDRIRKRPFVWIMSSSLDDSNNSNNANDLI